MGPFLPDDKDLPAESRCGGLLRDARCRCRCSLLSSSAHAVCAHRLLASDQFLFALASASARRRRHRIGMLLLRHCPEVPLAARVAPCPRSLQTRAPLIAVPQRRRGRFRFVANRGRRQRARDGEAAQGGRQRDNRPGVAHGAGSGRAQESGSRKSSPSGWFVIRVM